MLSITRKLHPPAPQNLLPKAAPAYSTLCARDGVMLQKRNSPDGSKPRYTPNPYRNAHVMVANTQIGKDGKILDTGHINIRTTPEEQSRGAAQHYGHSGTRTPIKSEMVTGRTAKPDAQYFEAMSKTSLARRFDSDKAIPAKAVSHAYDIGPLSNKTIATYNQTKPPLYETSGKDKINCVHVMNNALKVAGLGGAIEPYTTPQQLGALLPQRLANRR